MPAHLRQTLANALLDSAAASVGAHETAELFAPQLTQSIDQPTIAVGPAPEPGTVLRKTYQLIEEIGEGATGTVFRARHLTLDIPVAVKVFATAGDRQAAREARAEALVLARLNHPAVVRLWDFGVTNGRPYLVTEYLDGKTLGQTIKQHGRLPWEAAFRAGRAVASALKAADAGGVLHRDVKPDNIVLCTDGAVKLIDFGLAVVRGGRALYRTPSSRKMALAGTGAYMAPEQALESATVDHRADQYALGATLYHAVTGRTPFTAPAFAQMLLQHVQQPAPPAHLAVPGLSLAASGLIARLLAKDPADRFATHADLIRSIDRLLAA